MIHITTGIAWGPFADMDVGDPAAINRTLDGKDYARYAPTTEKRLSDAPAAGNALPSSACQAMITVLTNPISFRVGTTAATAGEGGVIPAGYMLMATGDERAFLENFRFIDTAAGASSVRIIYGRRA